MSQEGEERKFDIVRIIGDIPDKMMVGDEEVQLYPLSLGKMAMLADHEQAVNELIGLVRSAEKASDAEAEKRLAGAIDSAIEIYHILTTPNNGKAPDPLSDTQKDILRWKISGANVWQMMMFMRTATIPRGMLKNVESPGEKEKKNPTSATG